MFPFYTWHCQCSCQMLPSTGNNGTDLQLLCNKMSHFTIYHRHINISSTHEHDTRACTSQTSQKMHHHLAGKSTAGILKQLLIRERRRLQASRISPSSATGSMRQNEPLPGSSDERGTFTKQRLRERLCRTAFCTQ